MRSVETRAVGPRAVLVEVGSATEAAQLATWARARGVDAVEIVPAARTVLFDGVADPAALREALSGWSSTAAVAAGAAVEVPTVYDGPDIAVVAGLWGVDEAEVVRRHGAVEFVSAFCGFAPGFAYLTGLPEEWSVPRRDNPRPRVPAGSVGLAGEYCGVYPGASPGGWQLIGRTDVVLWDLDRAAPALLAPGTRVRFVSA